MTKFKIVYIISDSDTGGGQVYLLQLLKKFKNSFERVVICNEKGHYVSSYKELSSKTYALNWQMSSIKLLFTIRKILQKEQASVVHNHLVKACILGSVASFGIKQSKVYNSLHGGLFRQNCKTIPFYIFSSLNFLIARTPVKYLCISNWECRELNKQGIPKKKMLILYNGIDKKAYPFTPIPYQKDHFKIVCVARLHSAKGIFTLLDASKLLPKNITINIIGDGPLRLEVEERIKQEAISNVILRGFKKDISSFLAAAHLFVLPSNWEGFGMAIVEAMAMGKAVVSTNVGGVPEVIVHGEGGYLCEPKDAKKLSEYILQLYKNPLLLEKFGKNNRKRFEEKFTLMNMIETLDRIYRSPI